MTNSNHASPDLQIEVMMTAMVEQSRAQDLLYERTGVEEDNLLYSIEQLKLEEDPEF